MSENFQYTYSAEKQSEIDAIRRKYLPQEEQEKVIFTADRAAASFSFQDNRPFDEKEKERILTAKKAIKDKIIEYNTVMKYIDEI